MIYVVEMNEWGCGLYGSAGNLLTFVSFCDKNMGVWVICSTGYSPENTAIYVWLKVTLMPTEDMYMHIASDSLTIGFAKCVFEKPYIFKKLP